MESPIVHHLLLCRRASYDLSEPVTPYSLHHIAFRLRPPMGSGIPVSWRTGDVAVCADRRGTVDRYSG